LKIDFIQEVTHTTWLIKVVMMRKSNKKWRIYTDYTYPLLNINCLTDNALR